MIYYAGIGSRKTPEDIQVDMQMIAFSLEGFEFKLRSGGAEGADLAFESGVREKENKEIFLKNHEVSKEARAIARSIHPAWNRMGSFGKNAHARNVYKVLGEDLKTAVQFVICWTPGGKKVGGTRTAIVLAKQRGIPVYNLFDYPHLQAPEIVSLVLTNSATSQGLNDIMVQEL